MPVNTIRSRPKQFFFGSSSSSTLRQMLRSHTREAAPLLPQTTPGSQSVDGDGKYRKRRKQKQGEISFVVLAILLFLLLLLLLTVVVLLVQGYSHPLQELPSLLTSSHHRSRHDHRSRRHSHKGSEQELDLPYTWLDDLEDALHENRHEGDLPLDPKLLVSLTPHHPNPNLAQPMDKPPSEFSTHGIFFRISRTRDPLTTWEDDWEAMQQRTPNKVGPLVDYTQDDLYQYPTQLPQPPQSGYPNLTPLHQLFTNWPQQDIDHPPHPIREELQSFDYTTELHLAQTYVERKLPFKLRNVPELLQARDRWTDGYIASEFDNAYSKTNGKCQESATSFFAFFQPSKWNIPKMGLPPTRNNDWSFATWSNHARYADAVGLDADQPHFYWQAGVAKEERQLPPSDWTFISRDLPSLSSPTSTFVSPEPNQQKGIQCRFGERGVTAAVHYDGGKNMVAMITGAKRYVLLPPRQCPNLGIVTTRESALFRHSLLNFGKLSGGATSELEQAWLERAGQALAVETVLKEGEILHIPSHWFHYIISLQKSAQCNVRSGVDVEGTGEFGGEADVLHDKCRPV